MSENMIMTEMESVRHLGEQIGYGNLIGWASALWRDDLKRQGLPEIGAFIGVCVCSIKEERLKDVMKQESVYDSLVQKLKVANEFHRAKECGLLARGE